MLLQALVMLGGPAGRVDTVRAYALRSLKACHPDQVSRHTRLLTLPKHICILLTCIDICRGMQAALGPHQRAEQIRWMCRSPSSCRSWCSS